MDCLCVFRRTKGLSFGFYILIFLGVEVLTQVDKALYYRPSGFLVACYPNHSNYSAQSSCHPVFYRPPLASVYLEDKVLSEDKNSIHEPLRYLVIASV